MAKGVRELRSRIKSIGNTKKITKAMEMVAASKMRKSVSSVLSTRDYSNLAWATVLQLAKRTAVDHHPLLVKRENPKKVGLILVSSNRGLCGAFNMNIAQKAVESIKIHHKTVEETEFITCGSKGRDIIKAMKYNVVADFEKKDITVSTTDVSPISKMIIDKYLDKTYDKVFVVFMDFVSSLNQVPRVKQLLPIEPEPDEFLGVVGQSAGLETKKEFIAEKQEKYLKKDGFTFEYTFEPSPKVVLDQMLPRLIEMQIFQSFLETEASEHSARMLSMKNATDAAKDMIDDLTLSYNRLRQAGITQEIAEISSGAAALSK
jgi:F-type H+-transporting ATPase subunit gamma